MPDISRSESDFEGLPLRLAYSFLENNGLATEANEIRTSPARLGSYTSSVRRAKIIALLREKGLLESFVDTNWQFARTPEGKKRIEGYEKIYSRYQSSYEVGAASDSATDDETEAGTQFPLEEHLRDYLAENLGVLERGLSLWPVENGDAVEFPVDDHGASRRIDILARDRDGSPVVIELKVSRGHEKTIGQALYYRAKIKQRFGAHQVRIFIVAAKVSPQLRAAASEVSGVLLFEYNLTVTATQILS